jgi:hypothetical protein
VSPPSACLDSASKSAQHFDTFRERVDAFDRLLGYVQKSRHFRHAFETCPWRGHMDSDWKAPYPLTNCDHLGFSRPAVPCLCRTAHPVRRPVCVLRTGRVGEAVPAGFEAIVSSAYVAAVRGSAGANFGSVHLGAGFMTWATGRVPPGVQRDQAAAIFAFDLLVQNPDRCPMNPNLGTRSDRLGVYDQEQSFSFLHVPCNAPLRPRRGHRRRSLPQPVRFPDRLCGFVLGRFRLSPQGT